MTTRMSSGESPAGTARYLLGSVHVLHQDNATSDEVIATPRYADEGWTSTP